MKLKEWLIGGFSLAVALSLGVVIGWFSHTQEVVSSSSGSSGAGGGGSSESEKNWDQPLIDNIVADNIKTYLRNMTREPHLAGTEENKRLAELLVSKWREYGMDSAELVKYDVLLSYPGGPENRNQALIKYLNGTIVKTTALEEKILDQEQNNSKVVPPFNAYSKGGPPVMSRSVYYVNYGRAEDFEFLTRNKSVNLTGSIVIARYGKIFRGNKVMFAQQYGAVGILIYSDPRDYAYGINSTFESTFPNSWWLPPTGVQRGSTFIGNGDPLTPGYPAKDGVHRLTVESLRQGEQIPNIPSHPIGYQDAEAFLQILPGAEVEASWKGNLSVTYRYGGLLSENRVVELRLNNSERIESIYNAIGVIRGVVEPDRYVVLGNHRDAWIFGSVDPSSGTASLLEATRSFGQLLKSGWRPRRTLVFCSWGAEEYGLIGSNEWVEEFVKNLAERAVVYINVDVAAVYNYVLQVQGSPLLSGALYNATKLIPDPESPTFATIFDSWRARSKRDPIDGYPPVHVPGSGSDHASFYQKVGIPSVDMTYTYDHERWPIGGYPLYHSVYETFDLVAKFVDPTFRWHQAMARLWAVAARVFADSPLLPFDVEAYATSLRGHFDKFKSDSAEAVRLINATAEIDGVANAVAKFGERASDFTKKNLRDSTIVQNPIRLRCVNDQLLLLERAFTDPAGLPGYDQRKHLLYSQSSRDTYSGAAFPGIVDALYGIQHKLGAELVAAADEARREIARVRFAIESAATTIDDVAKLWR